MYMGSLSAHVCVYVCIVCVHVSVHPMFNTGPHNIYSNFRRVVLHFSYFIKLTLKKKKTQQKPHTHSTDVSYWVTVRFKHLFFTQVFACRVKQQTNPQTF